MYEQVRYKMLVAKEYYAIRNRLRLNKTKGSKLAADYELGEELLEVQGC